MAWRLVARAPIARTYVALRKTTDELTAANREIRALQNEVKRGEGRLEYFQRRWVTPAALDQALQAAGATYQTAEPFPHVVLADLVDREGLQTVAAEFAAMDRTPWRHSAKAYERKLSLEDERLFGPYTRSLIHTLNSGPFLTFLEKLTGISGLLADPYLRGGGLHEIEREGCLGVHADFNFHKRIGAYRRLNLLVYLNEHWDEAWGGHLELWDREGKACVTRIAPVFNRAVIFDTSNFSYHGHPHPLQCPAGQSRKSIALYYYSTDYPFEQDKEPHTTIFLHGSDPKKKKGES